MIQNILSISAITLTSLYAASLLLRKNKTLTLFAALLFTISLELFDLLSIFYPDRLFVYKRLAIISEAFLPISWLLFSLTFSRRVEPYSISVLQRFFLFISLLFPITAISLPVEKFFYSPDFEVERMLFLDDYGFVFYIGLLVFMIIALTNLESTLRTASRVDRWKIKFEILGTGSLFAMFIFYYSQGLLYRSINMNLIPIRSLIMIIAVSLMAYSRARRSNGVRLYVSRQMAYRSVVIFIVGLYLLGLGLMGEGMRYFGGNAQRLTMISLAFMSGIALVAVLLSETVRRRIKVLIHKNFYMNKYDYRTQWLQFTDRISSAKSGEELLKAILSGFSETFGTKGAALFIYDADRGVYLNTASFEMEHIDNTFTRDNSLIRYMEDKRWVFNARDNNPDIIMENREFIERYNISFAIPLFSNGSIMGFIALKEPININEVYTYEDYDLMKTLARQAFSAILNLRLADELSRAREIEAVGRVSAFVVHDLKNLLSALSLIVDNANDYIDNPDFQKEMLQCLSNTVRKMKGLIEKLKDLKDKDRLNCAPAELNKIVYDVVSSVASKNIIVVNGSSVFSHIDAEEIQKVVLNLVLNAIEATDSKGEVVVEVGGNEMAFIKVKDNGCGMTEEFINNHLFRPFRTTKKKGLGVGLYQCKQIVDAHNGRIEVKSEPGKGTVFTVYLPLLKRA